MFERYTDKARRTVFFARFEASQFGSPQIETEHLLLGALGQNKALTNRLLASPDKVDALRNSIASRIKAGPPLPTLVDLPLSSGLKRALAHSAAEWDRLHLRYIGTELLLLGLLLEEKCFAAQLLREQGITTEQMRELARLTEPRSESGGSVWTPGGPVWTPGLQQWLAEREADGKWIIEERSAANKTADRATHFALYAADEPEGNDENQPAPASEFARIRKRIHFAVKQMEAAIANHDFEKARFHSDEEGKERAHLRRLCEQFNLEAPPVRVPLVCIAVIDNDLFRVIRQRCEDYIEEGVAEVWLLDPSLKRAYTITKADGFREFKGEILQTANTQLGMDLRKIFG